MTSGEENDDATEDQNWFTQEALRRLIGQREAKQIVEEMDAAAERAAHPDGRWMDLGEFLDGSYVAPTATLGAPRLDDIQFFYPGKWHTLIGPTTAGKTFFALWQAKHIMETGGHVIYVHFEEYNPGGTVYRLLQMGADPEMLRKQFHWPENRPWTRGEMADEIERLTDMPTFAVLDGINAACGDHGWDSSTNAAVGAYRSTFVTPLTEVGCTVLSLGHPVKAPSRQGEAYSYGAAAWLNDVDGVGYRLKGSKEPLTPGKIGHSALSIVKDRYGNVMKHGIKNDDDKDLPWYFMGSFYVDDEYTGQVRMGEKLWQHLKVTAPSKKGGEDLDKYDQLGQRVVEYLGGKEGEPSWPTQNKLEVGMRAAKYTVSKNDLPVALERLAQKSIITWPEVDGTRAPRPGWLNPEHLAEDPP